MVYGLWFMVYGLWFLIFLVCGLSFIWIRFNDDDYDDDDQCAYDDAGTMVPDTTICSNRDRLAEEVSARNC